MSGRTWSARWLIASLTGAIALGAMACAKNPYVIGAVCPAADAGGSADPRCAASSSGTTFEAAFATSGATQLGALALPSGDVAPLWRLFGQDASTIDWTADVGGALAATAAALRNDAAPFNDGTGAAVLAAVPTYVAADATVGAVGADDFALEVVLRASAGASVLDKRAGATGWSLQENATGQLVLEVDDGVAPPAYVSSSALTANAWYHCLFWVGRATARADCDGTEGTPVTTHAFGTLDSATKIVAGGGAAGEVAEIALFGVRAGGLGDPTTWLEIGARRFAQLTGTGPRIARGSATPASGQRPSAAYLDLQGTTGARALFLVGEDWPRVACRVDVVGARQCGYLSEPRRTRFVPADPRAAAWQVSELTFTDGVGFPDPQVRFATLVPSTASAVHGISLTGTFGAAATQILSFFVNAASAGAAGARVDVSVGAAGTAVFDVVGGTVVSAPTGVRATIEPWGGGTFRCAYSFVAGAGAQTYALHLADGTGNEMFAGQGAGTVELGGLQLDVGLAVVGSLLGADAQAADRLTFAADGNLPTGASTTVKLQVLLPAGPRITDEAIVNINHDGSFTDQIQLFVRGDLGHGEFWGIAGNTQLWHFDDPASVIDGKAHTVVAGWDSAAARLTVDVTNATQGLLVARAPDFVLNRIDIGFSDTSSGSLEGLVGGLQIGAM